MLGSLGEGSCFLLQISRTPSLGPWLCSICNPEQQHNQTPYSQLKNPSQNRFTNTKDFVFVYPQNQQFTLKNTQQPHKSTTKTLSTTHQNQFNLIFNSTNTIFPGIRIWMILWFWRCPFDIKQKSTIHRKQYLLISFYDSIPLYLIIYVYIYLYITRIIIICIKECIDSIYNERNRSKMEWKQIYLSPQTPDWKI